MKQIVLTIIILTWAYVSCISQYKENPFYKFKIDYTDSLNYSFPILDTVVNKYKVFFVGDAHGYYSDVAVQFELLMYLYKSAHVRYYLCERGIGGGYALDKFVSEGDTTYFKYTLDNYHHWSDRYIFFDNIRKFNEGRPKSEQIRIFGIDFEYTNNVDMLKRIIYNHGSPPKDIKAACDNILAFNNAPNDVVEYRSLLVNTGDNLTTNEQVFISYLKDDFMIFKDIVTNPCNVKREDECMVSNIDKIVNREKEDKNYFVHIGFGHSKLNRDGLLGTLLNDKTIFKNKVLTFLPYYVNSEFKYGFREIEYKDRWGATINGKGYGENKLFDSYVGGVDEPGFRIFDLRQVSPKEIGKKGLAGQFLVIHYKSRAIE